jgi:beta-lactamase regulating signal transducer with metallopeptidase domain
LAIVWWLGAAGLVVRTVRARVLLGRFRRLQAACDDPAVGCRVESLRRRLGIRRAIEVRTSHALAAPVAFGVLRPVLVLPPAFAERFDRGQQEAILAHELTHLAAGDAVWLLLADLLAAMLWWQPVAWWLRRRLRAAGEAAADEASLLVPDGPHTLAACLVALGGRLAGSGRLGWLSMAGSGFRSGLGRRVQRLLDLDRQPPRTPRRGLVRTAKVLLVLALVIVAVTCTAWARPQAVPSEGETTMHVLSHSWRHSLAAALVVAFWTTAAPPVRADDQPKAEGTQAEHKEGRAPSATREQPPAAPDARGEHRQAESRRGEREGRELPPELLDRLEKRRALQQEAESVLHKILELKSGETEQAAKLFASLRDLTAQIDQLPVPPPAMARERPQLERLAGAMQAAKAKAQQFGGEAMSDSLEKASQDIRHVVEAMGRAGRGPGGEARPGREDGERRLQHLRAAIDNLRAAGMNEPADALEGELRRRLQDRPDQQAPPRGPRERAERGGGRPPEMDRGGGRPPDMERGGNGARAGAGPARPSGDLQQDVQQLRGEVQSLHQQLNEMREMLKRLMTHEQNSEHEAASPRGR